MKVKIIFFALLLLNINSFGQTNSINFNIGDVVTVCADLMLITCAD